MRRSSLVLSVLALAGVGCSAITATDPDRLGRSDVGADAGTVTRDAGPPSTLKPCVEMPASISSIQSTQGAAASAVRNALRRLVSGVP